MSPIPRKAVSIQSINGRLVALADDGTMWERYGAFDDDVEWEQIGSLPDKLTPEEETDESIRFIQERLIDHDE